MLDIRGTSLRQVALMNVADDEIEVMGRLNTVWAMTMDITHDNVLAYPEDIMVEKVEELYPVKYIDLANFTPYISEDGGHWLISNMLHIEDVDAFFTCYLHPQEHAFAA